MINRSVNVKMSLEKQQKDCLVQNKITFDHNLQTIKRFPKVWSLYFVLSFITYGTRII